MIANDTANASDYPTIQVEFAGKTKVLAERLASRQGYGGEPEKAGWVAPGVWLLLYKSPNPLGKTKS
jgi:hypothetical protein